MNMCEYANNVYDMFLLFFITKKNRKIVYEKGLYIGNLLEISNDLEVLCMAIPKKDRKFNFIRFNIWNEETIEIVHIGDVLFGINIKYNRKVRI